MQRIIQWLGTHLFSGASAAGSGSGPAKVRAVNPVNDAVRNRPARAPQPLSSEELTPTALGVPELDTDVSGRIEAAGPGKNVLIRNKYLREDTGTHETLRIIDDSLIDSGEAVGFDPYNTGKFNRSETWASRTWK